MTKKMKSFGPWIQTRNVIADVLGMAWDHSNSLPASEDEDSEFAKVNRIIEELLSLLKRHAILGLNLVDESIANSGLIEELKVLSSEAKTEADRIKNATEKLEKFTAVVNKITTVVEKISALIPA